MAERSQVSHSKASADTKSAVSEKPGRAKLGRFLTERERRILKAGPTYATNSASKSRKKQSREEHRLVSDFARAKRKATLHAEGALKDLAFLARIMDDAWLYRAATNSSQPPGEVGLGLGSYPSGPYPLCELLRFLAAKAGQRKAPRLQGKEGVLSWEETGPYVLTDLLGSMEEGLNAREKGSQKHTLAHTIQPIVHESGERYGRLPLDPLLTGEQEPPSRSRRKKRTPS